MCNPNYTIRPERSEDAAAIHDVNLRAFGQPNEADLVDALRANGASPFISLVAESREGAIVGHILFTPVTIEAAHDPPWNALGLAPMGVAQQFQVDRDEQPHPAGREDRTGTTRQPEPPVLPPLPDRAGPDQDTRGVQ